MISQLKVSFAGSFQCRLATDNDPTNASPTDPYGDYGPAAQGWTFAYREARFDRHIRLTSPVQLRSALVDPWKNAVVTRVECDRGAGLVNLPTDPLLNQLISLGSASFDTKSGGGGVTREALVGLRFAIGSMFQGTPATLPVLNGAQGSQTSWGTEYGSKKKLSMQTSSLDPVRAKVLNSMFDTYQSFFQVRCPTKPFSLKGVTFGSAVSGVLTQLEPPASVEYEWIVSMAFYRFDGDTLTGRMDGTLTANHRTAP